MRPPLIILAGGRGSRLGDLTKDIPKPMVDVHGKPFLYWLIQHYVNQGFGGQLIISTGYKSEVIENYPWPNEWKLQYLNDSEISNYRSFFGRPNTWVVNGDTFIPDEIPLVGLSTILSCHDVDAGAQFYSGGKVHIHPVSQFFDIGIPFGLRLFRSYFKNHPIYLSYLKKPVF